MNTEQDTPCTCELCNPNDFPPPPTKEKNNRAGYGIKVQTDTGRFVWLTETGTAVLKTSKGVMKFDSKTGADMYRSQLEFNNPHVTLITAKF